MPELKDYRLTELASGAVLVVAMVLLAEIQPQSIVGHFILLSPCFFLLLLLLRLQWLLLLRRLLNYYSCCFYCYYCFFSTVITVTTLQLELLQPLLLAYCRDHD